jgi:hypothetical protein
MENNKNHPNFGKLFSLFMISIFILDAFLFGFSFYFNGKGMDTTSDILMIFIFLVTFSAFSIAFFFLYNIKCPSCGKKTKTIKNKKMDMWQAYCAKCDVTWNLGLGTDTGP